MTRLAYWFLLFFVSVTFSRAQVPKRPNVLLIITDDQGHGDLGFHGNPKIRTPQLDKFARESVQFQRFYVSPVCAPTRASLMTGRYNYRTGVVDTYLGRAMMHPEEVTLAEMMAAAGYRTGIFGKWHLGDNYPMRPIDQGFQESLVHKGGGIGQPSDPPGGGSYFDPMLQHNGTTVRAKGYCTNAFTDATMKFIEESGEKPFFAYLAFNCPHTPLQVSEQDYLPYSRMNLASGEFPAIGQPLPRDPSHDETARIYGMITNVDDNLGRLFQRLESLKLSGDTIVLFMTDNGPQQVRYNSGLRDRKGSVYEGGIRVPFFVRWPGRLQEGLKVDRIAAHIDVAPTLLELCGISRPPGVSFDGASLQPLLLGKTENWPDRTLYVQWHRGDQPELYRSFAVQSQRFKLVQPLGAGERGAPPNAALELYDIAADPFELKNIAGGHPDIVKSLRQGYEAWFRDVGASRGYAPPRIHLGSPRENPAILTRQDWRGPRASWTPKSLGYWEVHVEKEGSYQITLEFASPEAPASVHFAFQGVTRDASVKSGMNKHSFSGVRLPAGPGRLEAWIQQDQDTVGVLYVEVRLLD
jgi:arylsulfatase A-like enzyme